MDTKSELTITVEEDGTVVATLIKDGEYHEEVYNDIDLGELSEFIHHLEQETQANSTVVNVTRQKKQLDYVRNLQRHNIESLKRTIILILLTTGILFIAYHDQF